jgi:outer membrane protein OmpA-like peptidoglycan-associated protein
MNVVHFAAIGALVAASAPSVMADVASAPSVKRFIGCPVYRDTDAGRKSGCWLVTDPEDGRQYDVTDARLKPILGQQILVEGVVTATNGELCGGVVLQPVDVSVLPQTCKGYVIPAEGHPGRRFGLPATVLQPTSVERTLPPPPYESRIYTIEFELNSDFLVYQYAELIIEQASLYAKASKPRRILITGYAATNEREVSGQTIAEKLSVAEGRARMIAEALNRLGIPRSQMELKWQAAPEGESRGPLTEASRRRAVIAIEL